MLKKQFIILLILSFIFTISCSKTVVAISTETIKTPGSTTPAVTETTSPINQETASPTTEAIEVGPVEYEGVMINPIEGLRFDNGTFFAQEGNPYGLEAETKAGVFIKDAFELNGQMENSIGLRPEVIEVLQQKYLEENKELRFPIPFDLEKDKGITMEIVKNEAANSSANLDGLKWGDFTVLAINAPKDTFIYSPLKNSSVDEFGGFMFAASIEGINDCYESLSAIPPKLLEKMFFKGKEKIHMAYIQINTRGCTIIPEEINQNDLGGTTNPKKIFTEIGSPLFKVFSEEIDNNLNYYFQGEFIINIFLKATSYKETEESGRYIIDKTISTGEDFLIKSDNNIFISILPADAKK